MIYITEYDDKLKQKVIDFFAVCMPESGRIFEPNGRHSSVTEINKNFEKCWCLMNDEEISGTVAIKKLSNENCELKMMYILKFFQGRGYGRSLLETVFSYAVKSGYKSIFLDAGSESIRAIELYKKYGFSLTERYNDNLFADIFMKRELNLCEIREAKETDLNGLLSLYTQLHDNTVPEMTSSLRDLWRDILYDKNHHIIICEENDRIISSCVIVIVPNLTRNQQPYAIIENVITEKQHRKKGHAHACLNYAREIASNKNCYKIMLMTGSKQESTLRFYERAGYNRHDKTAFILWL